MKILFSFIRLFLYSRFGFVWIKKKRKCLNNGSQCKICVVLKMLHLYFIVI